MKINKFFGLTAAAAAVALMATTASATTLKDAQNLGFVNCGISDGLPGFADVDKNGKWTGLDVDLCRAIAAAVLGSAEKVKYTLDTVDGFLKFKQKPSIGDIYTNDFVGNVKLTADEWKRVRESAKRYLFA